MDQMILVRNPRHTTHTETNTHTYKHNFEQTKIVRTTVILSAKQKMRQEIGKYKLLNQ